MEISEVGTDFLDPKRRDHPHRDSMVFFICFQDSFEASFFVQ